MERLKQCRNGRSADPLHRQCDHDARSRVGVGEEADEPVVAGAAAAPKRPSVPAASRRTLVSGSFNDVVRSWIAGSACIPKSPRARAARRRTRAELSWTAFINAATRFAGDTGNSANATTASSRTCGFMLDWASFNTSSATPVCASGSPWTRTVKTNLCITCGERCSMMLGGVGRYGRPAASSGSTVRATVCTQTLGQVRSPQAAQSRFPAHNSPGLTCFCPCANES